MQEMRRSQLGNSASPAEARMLAVCSEEKMDFKGEQENWGWGELDKVCCN